jgi:hypothetical protein
MYPRVSRAEGNSNRVSYLKLDKALYDCVQSALSWYISFVESLEKMGFRINPYDPCIAYAMVEGKQCTIVWYVDGTAQHQDLP